MMRAVAVALLFAGCGDDAITIDASTGDTSSGDTAIGPDARTCLDRATYPLMITAGAFPPVDGHPNVLVYSPQGFTPAAPLDLVVYIHGFYNCIENVIRDTGEPCTSGGAVRAGAALASQLDASGRNALLIVPELVFDQATGDPGQLGTQDGFRALLAETLSSLPAPLGPLDLAAHGRIIVASHSGGYQATSAIITFGGVAVDEVWLLDSLYGYTARFDAWVMQDLASFATGAASPTSTPRPAAPTPTASRWPTAPPAGSAPIQACCSTIARPRRSPTRTTTTA